MEREKVELLLDKLVDITTYTHSIQLCHEPGSGCKDVKKCKFQAHIKCDCHHESVDQAGSERTEAGESALPAEESSSAGTGRAQTL